MPRRLFTMYDFGGDETRWIVIDLDNPLAVGATRPEAEAKREKLERGEKPE